MQFKSNQDYGNPFASFKKRVFYRGVTTSGSGVVTAVGQVLAFDLRLASVDTVGGYQPVPGTSLGSASTVTATVGPGGASLQPVDLMWSSVVEPSAESNSIFQVYCVVTDLLGSTGIPGSEIEVQIQGVVTVKVASAAYAVGTSLMMDTTETTRGLIAFAAGTGSRPIAVIQSQSGSTVTSLSAYFYGQAGLTNAN